MGMKHTDSKFREWLRRYALAELLGSAIALLFAYVSFRHTHSYLASAGAGFIGEGIGFYGFFIVRELLTNARAYQGLSFLRRMGAIVAKSGTNLIVEFAPAEVLDNFFLRPALMFAVPQYIHPYAFGFLVGKLAADAVFYCFAIAGYEVRKRWLKR